MKKKEQYEQLVSDVRNDYLKRNSELTWCDECREINLWTYWQGRGHLNAQIMLVGQDWGCPRNVSSAVMKNIRAMNDGEDAVYLTGNDSPTDKSLVALFDSIGFDITQDDERLFFTNYVLGYRSNGNSGNFRKSWADADAEYFRRLLEIIHPRVLLCLGKDTLRSVFNCFGLSMPKGSYNSVIESPSNPFRIELSDGSSVYVFALAHCGIMGTLNRNRNSEEKMSIDLQRADWKRILPFFWSSPTLLRDYWEPNLKWLRSIAASNEQIAWCREHSVYAMREDVFGIVEHEIMFMQETYRNGLVITNYRQIMDEHELVEDDVIRAEKEWVARLSIQETAACLAYHFRLDHFQEGSLIREGIADGRILRLIERLRDLLIAIP